MIEERDFVSRMLFYCYYFLFNGLRMLDLLKSYKIDIYVHVRRSIL